MSSSSRPAGVSPAAASPREAVARWHALDRAFALARSVADRRSLAAQLPAVPDPVAEAHALQAELLRRAWSLRPPAPLPPWRHLPLPGASRLAWARLAVLVESTACRELVESEPALWATTLATLDPLDAVDPPGMLEVLLALGDPAADARVTEALPRAVARGLLAPDRAASLLLARGDAWSWSQLGSPWASTLALPRADLLRALRGPHLLDALPALSTRLPWATVREPLLASIGDPHERRRHRASFARWAGRLGDGDDIDELLGLDGSPGVATAVWEALAALHHRGHFVQPCHAVRVLALLAAGPHPGDDVLAGVLFVARHAIVAARPDDADDPLWLTLAPLLARWQLGPRPPAGLPGMLVSLAARTRRPATLDRSLGLLRDLALDLPTLDLEPLERVALARLDDAPDRALALLAATGGEATRLELTRRLTATTPGDGPPAPRLDEALLVLWHATPAAHRGDLLDALDPARLPAALVASLETRPYGSHVQEALLLRAGLDDPDQALIALCALATPVDLPRLALGVQRSVEKAIAAAPRWHDGHRPSGCTCPACVPDEARSGRFGEDAQQLPVAVADALDALGERWRTVYARPAWLGAPGPRLRAELLLRAVDAAPPTAVLAALLRSLLGLTHPRLPAIAAGLLDHDDPDVVKLAARLLARSGAAWLSLELCRGALHADDRRARACLAALAEVGGPTAEAAARAALDRRTMALKKEGALALTRVATAASAPALLAWLGQHDNPGLREALTGALRRALGEGFVPALLSALDGASGQERRQRLLVDALDGEVTPALARSVLGRAPGWERALLEAIAAGRVSLRGAPASALAAELADAGLAAPPADERRAPVAPFDHALGQLLAGWNPPRALAALAAWPGALTSLHVQNLRMHLDRWLDVLVDWRDVRPAALVEAVLRAGPGPAERVHLRAAAGRLGELLESLAPADRQALWPALEGLVDLLDPLDRIDLGGHLRACLGQTPGLARSPLTALTRCGLVLRRDDVERALAGVAGVPDPLALRRSILAGAFGVEASAPDPGAPHTKQTALRELIHEAPRGPTDALLWLLDRMEALRPIGVDPWLWPALTPTAAPRRPRSAAPTGPLDDLRAWLDGDAPAPTEERLSEALPDEVLALLPDDRAARRLAERVALAPPGSSLRRAYRPWLQSLDARPAPPVPRDLLARALAPTPTASPWLPAAARAQRRASWDSLWIAPSPGLSTTSIQPPDDPLALRTQALAADPEPARRALSRLAASPDEAWPSLVSDATRHPSPRVRAHALRLARRTLDRAAYVALVRPFLDDPDPTTRRSAVRTMAHAGDPALLPALVDRLLDPVAWVRAEALAAVRLFGAAGEAAIRHAIAHARPDHARRLARALPAG